jgi:hypothetical protein
MLAVSRPCVDRAPVALTIGPNPSAALPGGYCSSKKDESIELQLRFELPRGIPGPQLPLPLSSPTGRALGRATGPLGPGRTMPSRPATPGRDDSELAQGNSKGTRSALAQSGYWSWGSSAAQLAAAGLLPRPLSRQKRGSVATSCRSSACHRASRSRLRRDPFASSRTTTQITPATSAISNPRATPS